MEMFFTFVFWILQEVVFKTSWFGFDDNPRNTSRVQEKGI